MLKNIGEEELNYEIFSQSGIIKISGCFVWALIAGTTDADWIYENEKDNYFVQALNGYNFFQDSIKDRLLVCDLENHELDWKRLNHDQFEEICLEIINKKGSFQEALLTGASGDEGRDIMAKEQISTLIGVEFRNWCIQCKHYQSRPLGRNDIDNLDNVHKRFKFDVFCLMTSSTFSPGALNLIEEFKKTSGYKIILMDKNVLKDIILNDEEITRKFYSYK